MLQRRNANINVKRLAKPNMGGVPTPVVILNLDVSSRAKSLRRAFLYASF
jgi:hypothetical protein